MRNVILALVLGACASQAASAADIAERTRHFTVTGATLEELDRSLARNGPMTGGGDAGHPGATSVTFDGQVNYRPDGTRCRVAVANFQLRTEIILPRWKRPRKPDPVVVLLWETLERDVARHEQQHADIARNWVTRMEMAVRNLAPQRDCHAMETLVARTTNRYLDGHERAQHEFDRQESHEMSLRLRRLLRDRLRADSPAQAAD
ncbi:DUF922 domain-containing Zn-dependent protease [Aureimonas frigidaquae]|uniref:DUF922 domain-containing Zn-dependent protease n=1 Tax=Aureimonas frigidaquae TaxID=424757 RepID=UPI000784902E|nr:DUF922 domain-containing protein [Aureimonas frigidaquae]